MRNLSVVIFFVLILTSKLGLAQGVTETSLEYAAALREEFSRYGKDSSTRRVNLDSFDAAFFHTRQAFAGINANTRWMPLFMYHYSWTHQVGQELLLAATFDSLSSAPYVTQIIHGSRMVYSAEDLLEGFDVDVQYWQPSLPYLTTFPIILEREDPLNHTWTPIISGDYLVLRFVHSYPNGDFTSFYHETRFYFKRVP